MALTVFLCTPCKLGRLNFELIERIEQLGFHVLCAVKDSPDDVPYDQMFQNNVALIQRSNLFVAVLKDYSKDLAAEVGMAYAWGKPRIGLDFEAHKTDVMCYYALERVVKPDELEETLVAYCRHMG